MKPLRLLVLAVSAVFLGGVAYAVLFLSGGPGGRGEGSAYATAGCSVYLGGLNAESQYTANVTLDTTATSTTLGEDSTGNLLVDGTVCANQSATLNLTSTGTYISEINFGGTGNATQTVVLDQTQPGGVFPCHTQIVGNLAGETLQVNGAASEHVIVGATGVNLGGGGSNCAVGGLSGVSGWVLVGGTGSSTELDARGSTGPLATGNAVKARFVAGDSSETFDAGVTGSVLDFSQLTCPSSPTNPCSVTANSTGSTVNGVAKFNAALFYGPTPQSSYTYNFTTNEADFTEVDGNSTIPTSWYAPASSTAYTLDNSVTLQGSAGSYTVSSTGSGNQINAGSGTEQFTVSGDNVVMTGANGTSGKDTFTSTGIGNTFVAGTLPDDFFDSGTVVSGTPNNTVSFANLTTTSTNVLTIDADSSTTADSQAGTATLGSVTYTFLNSSGGTTDSNFTTFAGAATGNTTFKADSAGNLTFQGSQANNTADFSKAGTGITANLSGSTITTPNSIQVQSGQVLVSCGSTSCTPPVTAAIDSLSNVGTINGSKQGGNTFWGGSGTTSFVAKSANNTVNGASGGSYNVDMSGVASPTGNVINAGSGVESFTVVGSGITMTGGTGTGTGSSTFTDATGTGNTFKAGSLPDFFYDGGASNTVDFSGVGTSPQDQLAVNVAGSPEAVTLTTTSGASPVTIQNGQAEVETGTVYTFLNSATATGTGASSDFTVLTGPTSGNTQFLGGSEFGSGGLGNLQFMGGTGGNNSLSYPTVNGGVTVHLESGPMVGGTAAAGGFTPDSLKYISTVTGSPSGSNVFYAGPSFTLGSSTTYDFVGNGNGNTFIGGTGADIFTSNGNNNTFLPNTGNATLNDPTGTGNTVDFQLLTSATVTVNVTGGPVGSIGSTDEAVATQGGTSQYFFSGFGANGATFKGATGTSQTTFLAGSNGDTFDAGTAGDTLSFADASGNSLQVCTVGVSGVCTAGQAILGKVAESFAGIKVFDGLGTGNTTFVADDSGSGGYTFNGAGSGNTADFSSAAKAVQANLVSGQVTFSSGTTSADTVSNVSTVYGSASGGNTFTAASSTETFGDRTTTFPALNGADTIDFSSLQTVPLTPLTVNANGGGTNPYTATFGSQTYNFVTGGANFTDFTGALGGYTVFVAGSTPHYTFKGQGGGNSIDFSADASSITANLSVGTIQVDSNPADIDTIVGSDIPTVIGSPNGGNVFVAGTGPNETFKGGSNNTVDLSSLSNPAVVNVSQAGQSPQSTGFGTATSGGTIYDFTAFESSPTTFVGSTGGTTFYAGSSADRYIGRSASDTLSFADAQGTTLNICQAASATANCSAGQALLGNTTEYFQSIKTFNGLATQGSNTTFYSDDVTGGIIFNGQAGINTADFTAAGHGLTADMTKGTVSFSTASLPDSITGVTTVYGSGAGGNTFVAAPSSSETFGDFETSSTPGGDAMDFSHILGTTSANPLTVNASLSTPASGVAPYTAQFGNLTYNFSTGGSNFKSFTGSAGGNTTFLAASSSAGLTFKGANTGNTGDFSLTSGITANMTTRQVVIGGVTGYDTLTGTFSKVVGSPAGGNEFDGALTGTQFTAAGSPNTISYAGQTNPVTVNLVSDQVSGSGTTDSFSVPSTGKLTVEGSQVSDTFQIGTRAVTLQGGGGNDSIDLTTIPPPASGSTGVSVDLNGSILPVTGGPAIGGVTFTPGCGVAADLCVQSVTGTPESDTFIANQTLDPTNQTTISGGGGSDTLSLQRITSPVVADLPITTGTRIPNTGTCTGAATALPPGNGDVCSGPASTPGLFFSGVQYLTGSLPGGDDFFAGQSAPSTQYITETGSPGTLDSSTIPASANTSDTIAGIQIFASQSSGGSYAGTVNSSTAIGEQINFTNIGTFIGTQDNDTFTQSGSGPVTNSGPPPTGYVFDGRGGNNTVDLSSAPTGQLALGTPSPSDQCSTPPSGSGIPNPNDVTDTVGGVAEQFTCIGSVTSSSSEYQVAPGQTATVNGGGNGTIDLVSPPSDPQTSGCGVTVTMPVGTTPGSVQSNGCSDYNFSFTGVSTVIGTPYNDLFIPGSTSATLEGNGGIDGLSYAGAPAAAIVNLSGSTYTIPTGYTNSGTAVPAYTGTGGYGGTVKLQGILNATASNYGDILVGASGPGVLVGGSGNDRFVLTGGTDSINGGAGTNTVDLSLLPGYTTLDLGSWGWQYLGSGDGMLSIVPGTLQTAIGSPGGSALQAGNGDGITLQGSGTSDWLAAGVGNQTLVATGSGSTLVGGIGTDTMKGGAYPVTFVPGQGTDNLSSGTTGNTLSYNGVSNPVYVNLSSQQQQFTWPSSATSPTILAPQTASGGYGSTVNLSGAGISTVVGSWADDIFVTGSTPVYISGNGGDDLFAVTSGGNTLTAGNGTASRFLIDGPGTGGTNVIHGGGSAWIDYSQAPSGATVNLQTGTASGGFSGATETLSGVLNIEGSNSSDTLYAGAAYATVIGLNGNDTLYVSRYGQDTLESRGSGNDTFCDEAGQAGCSGMTVNPTAGSTLIGGSGNDFFFAANSVQDTIDGGPGYNEARIDSVDKPTTSNIQQFLP